MSVLAIIELVLKLSPEVLNLIVHLVDEYKNSATPEQVLQDIQKISNNLTAMQAK